MTECPSVSWDRYCAAQEIPEECPVCGRDNATEDGEPVFTDPAFCSQKCLDIYMEDEVMSKPVEDYPDAQLQHPATVTWE